MKKSALAAVAIITVLIVVVLSLTYVFTSNPQVEITSFNTTGTSSGSSIGVVNVWFVLNLTNTGAVDAKDLSITYSTNTTIESSQSQHLVYTDSTPPYQQIAEFEMGNPCILGGLKAGETKEFRFYWDVSANFNATTLSATVKSNEATLDHAILAIPPIPNVKITNFICTGVWHSTTLGPVLDLFSLSYTNLGMTDVKDLTVTLNTSKTTENYKDPYNRTSTSGYDPYDFLDETINGKIYTLESLQAKETKSFEKSYSLEGGFLLVQPFALTATLKSNNIILDQATIMIPISG